MTIKFRCRTCDLEHEDLPVFGPDAPLAYERLSESERASAALTGEQCEIGMRQFLRARLTSPIADAPGESTSWLVWVELSAADYDLAVENWHTEGRERAQPVLGTLGVALPYSPPTEGLRVEMRTMPVGQRPEARVLDEHPLRTEQDHGVELADATARAEALLHAPSETESVLIDDVLDCLRARFGPESASIRFDARAHAKPPPVSLVDVFTWRPEGDRDVTVLATVGMATRPMPGSTVRAEAMIAVADLEPRDEMSVAAFLANVSNYPWDIGAALDHWHTLGSDGPIPCFPRCVAMLLREPLVGPVGDLETRDGNVRLLCVMPITAEERAIARRGRDALETHFDHANVDPFVDRP